MRLVANILDDIEQFQPTAGSWLALDDLLQELWTAGVSNESLLPLFRLLERFPNDESAGVLWGVLHGIETHPDYETELVNSLQRHPTDLTVTMVRRIANSGQQSISGQPIADIYRLVIRHLKASTETKKTAQSFLQI